MVRSGDLVKASNAEFVVIKRGPQCNLSCATCAALQDLAFPVRCDPPQGCLGMDTERNRVETDSDLICRFLISNNLMQWRSRFLKDGGHAFFSWLVMPQLYKPQGIWPAVRISLWMELQSFVSEDPVQAVLQTLRPESSSHDLSLEVVGTVGTQFSDAPVRGTHGVLF